MPGQPRRSLMFNLGAFFGNLVRTASSDLPSPPPPPPPPTSPQRRVVRQDVHEEQRDTPRGKVTLRRTTIEEVELPPPLPHPPPPTDRPA